MAPALPLDLELLPEMSVAELRALWAQHMPGPAPALRRLLIRDLAWRVQERIHGGNDLETRRLLRKAIRRLRAAQARASQPSPPGAQRRLRASKTRRELDLPTSARLIRTYRGVRHEVTVLGPREFRHRDKTYASLTEVARVITGSHCSGPLFFGLAKRAGRLPEPEGAHA